MYLTSTILFSQHFVTLRIRVILYLHCKRVSAQSMLFVIGIEDGEMRYFHELRGQLYDLITACFCSLFVQQFTLVHYTYITLI